MCATASTADRRPSSRCVVWGATVWPRRSARARRPGVPGRSVSTVCRCTPRSTPPVGLRTLLPVRGPGSRGASRAARSDDSRGVASVASVLDRRGGVGDRLAGRHGSPAACRRRSASRRVPRAGAPGRRPSPVPRHVHRAASPTYHIHTQGHPPGLVLVLWALDRSALGGTAAALALCSSGGAAPHRSRRARLRARRRRRGAGPLAAPFLALAPAAIWWRRRPTRSSPASRRWGGHLRRARHATVVPRRVGFASPAACCSA